jgi:hypothetical protein
MASVVWRVGDGGCDDWKLVLCLCGSMQPLRLGHLQRIQSQLKGLVCFCPLLGSPAPGPWYRWEHGPSQSQRLSQMGKCHSILLIPVLDLCSPTAVTLIHPNLCFHCVFILWISCYIFRPGILLREVEVSMSHSHGLALDSLPSIVNLLLLLLLLLPLVLISSVSLQVFSLSYMLLPGLCSHPASPCCFCHLSKWIVGRKPSHPNKIDSFLSYMSICTIWTGDIQKYVKSLINHQLLP